MGYTQGYTAPEAFTSKKRGESMSYEKETVEDVLGYQCLAIPDRNITQKTAEHYGVRTALSTEDGSTPIAHYFPYYDESDQIVGFKKRDLTKHKKEKGHFSIVGLVKVDVVKLFGTHCGNSTGGKKVWICEGEYDSMIVHQTLKDEYPRGNPTVLSIGFGTANAVQHIGQKMNMKFLNKFPEKITVFDNDRATVEEKEKGIKKGNEATADVYGLIPDILVAPLPEGKDPCEVYNELTPKELYWMVMKPIRFTPEGFVRYEEVENKAKEMPILGKAWPWETLYRKTLGRRLGEGYYIGAGVKQGKSEWANKLIQHITENDKNSLGEPQKVAVFKFEEQPDITIKKVAGKFFKKDFSNPEKILFIDEAGREHDIWGEDIKYRDTYFTQEELDYAVDTIGPRLVMYNNYGRCHWDELKGAIRHAVLVEHIEDIIIDPITRLTSGMSASEASTELERFADEISKMSKDLGFTYYCFCHLKAPSQGPSHEFGGKVVSSQFTGSRAMMRAAYYLIGIERNKDPELSEKEINTSHMVLLDDRKHGRTGKIPMFYDVDTGDYVEPPEGFLEDDSCQTLQEWYSMYPNGKPVEETIEDF
jgi:twinkle protein